jgi:acyl phosphate:glycerol-3-phosphate acyltransferase
MFCPSFLKRLCFHMNLTFLNPELLFPASAGLPAWAGLLLVLLACYVLGSVPFSWLIAKSFCNIDLRTQGSGNVGATNVLRTCGKKIGTLAYIADGLKGLVPVLVLQALYPAYPMLHVFGALAILLGHSRSVFLKFQGGKSAMSGLGALLGLHPLGALLTGLLAVIVMKLTKAVSLGSLAGALVSWAILMALGAPLPYILYTALAGVLVLVRHRSNIQRLLSGTENKF